MSNGSYSYISVKWLFFFSVHFMKCTVLLTISPCLTLLQAEFFNRYLSDPKRPQMPEAPASQRPPGNQMGQMYGQHQHSQGMMGWGPRPQMMMYGKWQEVYWLAWTEHAWKAQKGEGKEAKKDYLPPSPSLPCLFDAFHSVRLRVWYKEVVLPESLACETVDPCMRKLWAGDKNG